jgi:DNA polymerase III delta prime subunit
MNSKFDDYIKQVEKYDLHEHITRHKLINEHIILYGPGGIGKYSQALKYIKEFSPSKCKYEKKMTYMFQNKKEYVFKVSDVHFEIDMELLGCNSKVLFNSLFYHIVEIISMKTSKYGIILCKNFHKIHSELLDIFFTYMQSLIHKKIKIQYVLLTDHISFIPDNILSRCQIVNLKRPTKTSYQHCIKSHTSRNKKYKINKKMLEETLNQPYTIDSINHLLFNTSKLNEISEAHIKKIIYAIENIQEVKLYEIRDMLYNLLIFNVDISTFLFYCLNYFVCNKKLNTTNMEQLLYDINHFFSQYNNNYRPIFHLEAIFYKLYIAINTNGKGNRVYNSVSDVKHSVIQTD